MREMAAASNEEAFRTLLEPHRRRLTLHCYRMLGSLQDAEEATQEALVRAWQRFHDLKANDATKPWLYRIATNVCLDFVKKKKRRRRLLPFMTSPPSDPAAPWGSPAHENVWLEPMPDTLLDAPEDDERRPDARISLRESVGLAFVAALQLLTPKQRAALLLVDVIGWSPDQTAELLGITVAATNSLLQRARQRTRERSPAEQQSQQPAISASDDDLLRRYISTWESRDLEGLVALLAEDAVLSMPPQPEWYAGRAAIRQFLSRMAADQQRRYRSVATRANGSPAAAVYVSIAGGPYEATAINVLSLRSGQIARLTRFTSPRFFEPFGLPARLDSLASVEVQKFANVRS